MFAYLSIDSQIRSFWSEEGAKVRRLRSMSDYYKGKLFSNLSHKYSIPFLSSTVSKGTTVLVVYIDTIKPILSNKIHKFSTTLAGI